MTAGPVAVVTGGGSGIGLATCTRLAKDGFTVAALDLQPSGATGIVALVIVCDVTDEADVSMAMAAVTAASTGTRCRIGASRSPISLPVR